MWIVAVSFMLIALAALLTLGIGKKLSVRSYTGSLSEHFDGKKFTNIDRVRPKGLLDILIWKFTGKQGKWKRNLKTTNWPPPLSSTENLCITFVNHSTFLIQWQDLNILTDPIWSVRCSPFSFVGPKRMRSAGIRFEDLPPIDIVLLSHNHYDHLDLPTLRKLEAHSSPMYVTTLGVGQFLKKHGLKNVAELGWWDSISTRLKIHCVPAQHSSGRGFFDRDNTLWGGFILESRGKRVYYSGDTGYGKFFKTIQRKYGDMDVSFIPIGAYQPRWFMYPVHVGPLEALRIHKDVKSKTSIAMHFGTFALADEGQGEAESDLMQALQRTDISPNQFLIPTEGKALQFDF